MNSDTFQLRQAPYWNPDDPNGLTFRAWVTDLMQWTMMTDLAPHAQAASVASRLGGTARELVRTLDPDEYFNGGMINGVFHDPVTYIVTGLHQHYAPLEEETRLAAMTEFMAFSRRHGESMNSMLARYDLVRNRARVEGNFTFGVEGCALQLMRAINATPEQMTEYCREFNGVFPTTEEQFTQLKQLIRRRAHIIERSPGNMGQFLHGNRQAAPGAYHTETSTYYQTPATGVSATPQLPTFMDILGGSPSQSSQPSVQAAPA